MGTIIARKRSNGQPSYLCQIFRKSNGRVVRESRTFRDHKMAKAWVRQREAQLDNPHEFKTATAPTRTLGDAIGRYIDEHGGEIGRTKAACLAVIQKHALAAMACNDIASSDIVSFARTIGTATGLEQPGPSTVGNYLSHLQSVFAIAEKAWGYPLAAKAMTDALFVLRKQRAVTKSNKRDRRPALEELDRILSSFEERSQRAPHSAPMADITLFALFSTRRQEEITRIQWADYEPAIDKHPARVLVRDLKHPGAKKGNNVWCELTPEAARVIERQPKIDECIFPYTTVAIKAAFERACKLLGIEDLHFHDLRHEGVSRLFEAGWDIPHVSIVSGHRSWASLQRYAHIRQRDDKYAGWKLRP